MIAVVQRHKSVNQPANRLAMMMMVVVVVHVAHTVVVVVCQVCQCVCQIQRHLAVKTTGWLVQEQHIRIADHLDGNACAAAFTATDTSNVLISNACMSTVIKAHFANDIVNLRGGAQCWLVGWLVGNVCDRSKASCCVCVWYIHAFASLSSSSMLAVVNAHGTSQSLGR
jgi:hypothetical protein